MSQEHEVPKMVAVYKKLFILLISVTAFGIVLTVIHMPVWITIILSLGIIAVKGKIVYDSFKGLLVGKNILTLTFALTIFFFLMVIILPALNQKNHITGTEDISKAIQAEQPIKKGHHDGH